MKNFEYPTSSSANFPALLLAAEQSLPTPAYAIKTTDYLTNSSKGLLFGVGFLHRQLAKAQTWRFETELEAFKNGLNSASPRA